MHLRPSPQTASTEPLQDVTFEGNTIGSEAAAATAAAFESDTASIFAKPQQYVWDITHESIEKTPLSTTSHATDPMFEIDKQGLAEIKEVSFPRCHPRSTEQGIGGITPCQLCCTPTSSVCHSVPCVLVHAVQIRVV